MVTAVEVIAVGSLTTKVAAEEVEEVDIVDKIMMEVIVGVEETVVFVEEMEAMVGVVATVEEEEVEKVTVEVEVVVLYAMTGRTGNVVEVTAANFPTKTVGGALKAVEVATAGVVKTEEDMVVKKNAMIFKMGDAIEVKAVGFPMTVAVEVVDGEVVGSAVAVEVVVVVAEVELDLHVMGLSSD